MALFTQKLWIIVALLGFLGSTTGLPHPDENSLKTGLDDQCTWVGTGVCVGICPVGTTQESDLSKCSDAGGPSCLIGDKVCCCKK